VVSEVWQEECLDLTHRCSPHTGCRDLNSEWQVTDRRYFSEGSMAAFRPIDATPSLAAPATLTA
jgi:hypothetical protein